MFAGLDESLLRAVFAPARTLEPSEADVARVVARAVTAPRRAARLPRFAGLRRLAPGLVALVLLAGCTYAVPPTRAAIDEVTGFVAGAFTGWVSGGSSNAPGRALVPGERAPGFLRDAYWAQRHARDPRVIAEAGGYKLIAYLESHNKIGFDLGDTGVGMGGYTAKMFDDHFLYVLGPGAMQIADAQGHVPLFGIVARSVRSVELVYESGPPLRVDNIAGGFVLLAEPGRGPREVIALNSAGDVVGRELVDNSPHSGPRIDWEQYASTARQ